MTPEYVPGMTLDDCPIPEDARVTGLWPEQMRDFAEIIGAYDTLMLIARFGGRRVVVPEDPERNPFRYVLDAGKVKIFSHVYAREELFLVTAKGALSEARRAPILASVRNGDMTAAEAQKITGLTRRYISKLLNDKKEAMGAVPLRRTKKGDDRQIEMFATRQ